MTSRLSATPVFSFLADIAFPPRCPSCRGPVEADGNFCAACFSKLRLISAPLCDACGIPFAIPVEEGTRCPECLEHPPSYAHARCAIVYDAVSAPLVSALKFHDQWAGLERCVRMMRAAGHGVLDGIDVVVPVPLHWRRLWRRRYNQSALLAYGVARALSLPCAPALLRRIRPTRPQMKLDRAARRKNVARAFAVADTDGVKDKVMLLVDDVITTGATVEACAKALRKAGAKEVRVLALARTVRE